jgi:hypothetical protein
MLMFGVCAVIATVFAASSEAAVKPPDVHRVGNKLVDRATGNPVVLKGMVGTLSASLSPSFTSDDLTNKSCFSPSLQVEPQPLTFSSCKCPVLFTEV